MMTATRILPSAGEPSRSRIARVRKPEGGFQSVEGRIGSAVAGNARLPARYWIRQASENRNHHLPSGCATSEETWHGQRRSRAANPTCRIGVR